MSDNWFDNNTGLLTLDEDVAKSPTFKAIMADGVVTDAEVRKQSALVLECLLKAHESLDPKQRRTVGRLLVEMSVLHAVMQYRELADIKTRTLCFGGDHHGSV